VGYLDAHAECGLVYCDTLITGESPLAGQAFSIQAPSSGPVTLLSLIQQTCNIPLSTVVMRREDIVAAGMFDPSLRRGQDFELWLRLAARGTEMHCQKIVLAERRVRLEGLSGTAVTEIQRALHVLERFGTTNALDVTSRTALQVRTSILHDRLAIEEAKQRIRELNFAAARTRLAATRHQGQPRVDRPARGAAAPAALVPGAAHVPLARAVNGSALNQPQEVDPDLFVP
jgi:hypothetical protein